ncbi:MAG: serine protein kinase RIO [Candidatus Thermoplasmatota archaeon]
MSFEFDIHDKWLKKLDQQTRELLQKSGSDRKTLSEVFDRHTLLNIGKLISDQIIEYVDFPISTGKEANVFRAVTPNQEFVALKIYRTSTLTFKHIIHYIEGDPRFRFTTKNRRGIILEWAKKEFKNLERMHQEKIRVPVPIKRLENILVMEYIGSSQQPAPMLKDYKLKFPQRIFNSLTLSMKRLYQHAGLVHADLSPYNILLYKEKPVIIDVGQAVVLEHPSAEDFLKRDIHNIVSYFRKYKITASEEQILKKIHKQKGKV